MTWEGLRRDAEAAMAKADFSLRSADIDDQAFGNWVMSFARDSDGVGVRFMNDRGQVSADGSEVADRLNSVLERCAPNAFVARLESHLDLLRESV